MWSSVYRDNLIDYNKLKFTSIISTQLRLLLKMELIKRSSQSKLIKSAFIILLGSIALTISAKIKIPFYPVPMTMQTFVVMFLGLSFGYKIALATVGLYLFEGIVGLPVFSNSPERGIGLTYFLGPTMGYLIGFFSACFLASFVKEGDNYFLIFP